MIYLPTKKVVQDGRDDANNRNDKSGANESQTKLITATVSTITNNNKLYLAKSITPLVPVKELAINSESAETNKKLVSFDYVRVVLQK